MGDVAVFLEEAVERGKLLGGQVANDFICTMFSLLSVWLAPLELGQGIGTQIALLDGKVK